MAYLVHASLIAVVLIALGGEGQLNEPGEAEHPCVYVWTPFFPWTPCNVSCGQGYQTQNLFCIPQRYPCTGSVFGAFASVAGQPVIFASPEFCSPGSNIEKRECYGAVNGNWSEWGCWGECKNGTRQRHRNCNNPVPTGWGNYCVGNHTETERCGGAGQDIVFVLDGSSSISQSNFSSMVDQVNSVIQSLDLDTGSGPLTKVRVGIEVFNDEPIALKHLNSHVLPTTPYPHGGGANHAAGMSFARNTMFTEPNGDRPDVPNTVVVLSDGKTTYPIPAAIFVATAAKNDGIKIIAIGVGDNVNVAHLEGIVSDPSTDLYLPNDFCSIASDLKRIFNLTENPAESERIRTECAEKASDDSEAQFAPQEGEVIQDETPH